MTWYGRYWSGGSALARRRGGPTAANGLDGIGVVPGVWSGCRVNPRGWRHRRRTYRSGNRGHRQGAGTRPGPVSSARRRPVPARRRKPSDRRLSPPAHPGPAPARRTRVRPRRTLRPQAPPRQVQAPPPRRARAPPPRRARAPPPLGSAPHRAAPHRAAPLGLRRLGLGLRGRGALGPGRRAGPGVVAQGRLDHLQAPLGAGPPGEFGPRQDLRHPRGVFTGELQPDGDRIRLGLRSTCHAIKVPRTVALTEHGRG